MLHLRKRLAAALALGCWTAAAPAVDDDLLYELDYRIRLVPKEDVAEVSVELGDNAALVRAVRFNIVEGRHTGFDGDGEIDVHEEYVHWIPPKKGGRIEFSAVIDHERGDHAYDALLTEDWAVFRGDDVVPPARVRTIKGSESRARLRLSGPNGWAFVSPYRENDDGWALVEHADRRFDRPTGWMTAGNIGVRRERIRGVQVAVAGPVDQGVRRMDMLAFLNWTLPELLRAFGDFAERLLIVSAGDPMWRGGLSGPGSLYVHADRPLISENGTSALLHELVHTALGLEAARSHDWIVEGLAEFYSLEILLRSGTITRRRYGRAYDQLRDWSEDVEDLKRHDSEGTITARAVLVMRRLDEEIRDETDGHRSLEDVAQALAKIGRGVTLEDLRDAAEEAAGEGVEALRDGRLPGLD